LKSPLHTAREIPLCAARLTSPFSWLLDPHFWGVPPALVRHVRETEHPFKSREGRRQNGVSPGHEDVSCHSATICVHFASLIGGQCRFRVVGEFEKTNGIGKICTTSDPKRR
jgi:hypothetical protein